MVRLGINRALWIFGVVQAVAILGFAWLAYVGADLVLLALVIGFEAFGVGLGTAAFVVVYRHHDRSALYRDPVRAVHQPGRGAAHLRQFRRRVYRRRDRMVPVLYRVLCAGAARHADAAENCTVERQPMKKLPRLPILLLCLALPPAPVLPAIAQDEGVSVDRMSRLRGLVPAKSSWKQQATMQYEELKQQASQKGALAARHRPAVAAGARDFPQHHCQRQPLEPGRRRLAMGSQPDPSPTASTPSACQAARSPFSAAGRSAEADRR